MEYFKQTRFARPIGEHVTRYAAEGVFELQAQSFFLLIVIFIHIVMRNWEITAVLALLITLNLLAAFFARRPESPGRFARFLCAGYFSTLRDSATHRPLRRTLRLPILFAGTILPLLSFIPIVHHHCPPFVDPRILSRTQCWDYLRENNFFLDPPPPAQTPENQPP